MFGVVKSFQQLGTVMKHYNIRINYKKRILIASVAHIGLCAPSTMDLLQQSDLNIVLKNYLPVVDILLLIFKCCQCLSLSIYFSFCLKYEKKMSFIKSTHSYEAYSYFKNIWRFWRISLADRFCYLRYPSFSVFRY